MKFTFEIANPVKFIFEVVFIFFLNLFERYTDSGINSILKFEYIIQAICYSFVFCILIELIQNYVRKKKIS